MTTNRTSPRAFTLLDVMITVTIIAILAAVTIPLVSQHLDRTQQATAQSNETMISKAIGLYYQQHGSFPPDLDALDFVGDEAITMPRGFQLQYNPNNGNLDLVVLAPEDIDGALAYVNVP